PVTIDASTGFVNGILGDLQANAQITIDGALNSAGDVVVTNQVTFGRPVSDRTTETFDFNNFTNISVLGFSKVTVVRGPDFSVEVMAVTDIATDVQVTQNGDTITIGNDTTQILNAFVTMPVLNRIDVGAGALANVTLKDFNQMQMTVNLRGVSVLRGEGLLIGDLTATVSGVSLLNFGDIRPIGNASIDISGVSRASLNMDIGSALAGSVRTGQGTGASALVYYGTNVAVNVTTDSISSVFKLGETRP
ncbi:MAG: GIN domain-containing protein, partial [Planctomycetota bacterium]